jgi:hypothetical protein
MSDRVRPAPAKYKTTNWRRYNKAQVIIPVRKNKVHVALRYTPQ